MTRDISTLSRVAPSRLIVIVPRSCQKVACAIQLSGPTCLMQPSVVADATHELVRTCQSVGEHEGFQDTTSDRFVSAHMVCSISHRTPARRSTREGFGGQADGCGRSIQRPRGYRMTAESALLVSLDLNAHTGSKGTGDVDDNGVSGRKSGTFGDEFGQLIHDRVDAHGSRG